MKKLDPQKLLAAVAEELLYQMKDCGEYLSALAVLNEGFTKHNSTICIAKDFFSVVQFSLINTIMVGVIKLYDRNKDSYSVPKCIAMFKDVNMKQPEKLLEWDAANEQVQKNEKKLESYEEALKHLVTRRDKYYMHNDKGYFLNWSDLKKTATFSFDDARELLSIAKNTCEVIYRVCCGNEWRPHLRQGSMFEHERDFSGLETLLKTAEAAEQAAK